MNERIEEAWREWIGDEADHSQVGFVRKAFFDAWELASAARDVEWCTAIDQRFGPKTPEEAVEWSAGQQQVHDDIRQHLAERIKALEGGIVAENNRVAAEHSALRARIAELEDQLCDFRGVVED